MVGSAARAEEEFSFVVVPWSAQRTLHAAADYFSGEMWYASHRSPAKMAASGASIQPHQLRLVKIGSSLVFANFR